jgi:hypothetical protein
MSRFFLVVCLAAATVVIGAARASAHVTETAGDLTISVGWRDEPSYAGLPNAVEVTAVDKRGEPVVDLKAGLTATISFGDATTVRSPTPREPGAYRAEIVPSQPGTYSIHVMGKLAGQAIDVDSTCSDATFACVAAASEIQFPPLPANGGGDTAGTPGPVGDGDGSGSDILAIAALALSAVALGAAVTVGVRSRRTGRPA